MRKSKHIIAIIIVLTVMGGICFGLSLLGNPDAENHEVANSEEATTDSVTQAPVDTTVSFEDSFKEQLQIIEARYNKKKARNIWTLGRGQTIIVYLLQAQRFIQSHGGTVLNMKQLYKSSAFQSAEVDLLKPDGDTLKLELQVSENIFRSNASVLSIGFQVTDLTPEIISALNQLDIPFDLLVPPFGLKENVYENLDKVKEKEVILWLTMESTRLNKSHNKYRPLRIHHTEDQIETVINDAVKTIPYAKGIATRFGEQAVEHKQLLQAIIKPVEKNKLWFLDISSNKQSKVMDACKDFETRCKISNPYNPDNSSLQDYVKQKNREAIKSGLAAMILPLTMETIGYVTELSKKVEKQGTTLVNLSTFMTY
ncbi:MULTISPECIES: divergent polysaccharide deacetylase family protein [unclassified Fibrobacter]|uniref:divergent polysaccharide deacetylase family protein n=1 Tax=unclassified Fibrobacter TaxID=2634177 RepID=UPI000D6AFC9B|nr:MULTISPECIES: divergent polysaccharide deacetylase family protein [unclassified Fibrobacter]PWJ60994.1 hypothetical protein BGX12_13224 [Fibrobacter sp. UWR4]PZW65489.1 hypothetical protein C8E88_103424 [Fibrobacter sp. UWR1]